MASVTPLSEEELARCAVAPEKASPVAPVRRVSLSAREKKSLNGVGALGWPLGLLLFFLFGQLVARTTSHPIEGLRDDFVALAKTLALSLGALWGIDALVKQVRASQCATARYHKALEHRRRDIANQPERLAAEASELTERLRRTYRYGLSLAAEANQHLSWADDWVRGAENEYYANAFAPFWDALEQAARNLADYQDRLRRLGVSADSYYRDLHRRSHTFPAFPVDIVEPERAMRVASDLSRVMRLGQTNFHFASIWEHRATRNVMIAGFRTLGAALNNMTSTIASSVGELQESVSSDIATVVQEQIKNRDLIDRRSLEQNRMLENIQRGRRPGILG